LFYVALTRAKTQLYLTSYTRTFAGSQLSNLKYLEEGQDSTGEWRSPLLPSRHQAILPVDQESAEPLSSDLSAYWQHRHEQALSNADLHSLLHDRLERFQISPTHVNDFTDVQYCGPQAFFLRTILRFPTAPRPEVQFGNAMHETLEWICKIVAQDDLMPSKQALQKTFEKRLRDKKLRSDITAQYLERGLEALTAYIQQRSQVLAQKSIAEYNFRNEGVFIGEAHLTGKIDKLIIDRKQKTITIVDYKTGKKSYTSWKHDTKIHKYRLQLYFYKMLVEGSHTFAGFTVNDAYLEFVEPDEDGNINKLHLAFDETEYTRAQALIEVIWKRIKSLDLPSIEGYDATIGGIEAFEASLLE
jgi:DNA helicase-2/ATP-dependent DNA helicase PcrA